MSREAGKDHFRRPSKISQEELDRRWEQTFGKKEKDLTGDKKCGNYDVDKLISQME
jgi:hypothetical protein